MSHENLHENIPGKRSGSGAASIVPHLVHALATKSQVHVQPQDAVPGVDFPDSGFSDSSLQHQSEPPPEQAPPLTTHAELVAACRRTVRDSRDALHRYLAVVAQVGKQVDSACQLADDVQRNNVDLPICSPNDERSSA